MVTPVKYVQYNKEGWLHEGVNRSRTQAHSERELRLRVSGFAANLVSLAVVKGYLVYVQYTAYYYKSPIIIRASVTSEASCLVLTF